MLLQRVGYRAQRNYWMKEVLRSRGDARPREIAENLHGAELTVQERVDHIAEWGRRREW